MSRSAAGAEPGRGRRRTYETSLYCLR
jgi:hypothetical protein